MKISIGSMSEQKIKYLKEVLSELQVFDCEIMSCDVASDVSDQPLTSDETRIGSENRAKKAFTQSGEVNFAIGVEVGYELDDDNNYEIFCWVTIFDGQDVFSAKSNNFLLPKFHQEKLKAGQNLGDHVREFYVDGNFLKTKLGLIIRDRDTIIKNALMHCLLHYFNKRDY